MASDLSRCVQFRHCWPVSSARTLSFMEKLSLSEGRSVMDVTDVIRNGCLDNLRQIGVAASVLGNEVG